jgi:hypothetical protein
MDLKTAMVIVLASIPFFLMTVWAIVDSAQKDFGNLNSKIIWCLVAAIPYVGFLIYLVVGFRRGHKPKTP